MGKTVVGLDIGGSNLRGVEVSVDKNNVPTIVRVGEVRLPFETVVSGEVKDPGALAVALKTLWKNAKFGTRDVRIGISSDRVLARPMVLDWMADGDFAKVLPSLVKDHLPIEVGNYYLDYHTLDEFVIEQEDEDNEEPIRLRKKKILLSGAERKTVDALVRAVRDAGLKPISVDAVGLALLRVSAQEFTPEETADVSVDLGADTITIVVHRNGQPLYVRIMSGLGGNTITAAIADALKIKNPNRFAKAEDKKRAVVELGYALSQATRPAAPRASVFGHDEDEAEEKPRVKKPKVKITEEMLQVSPIITEEMSQIVGTIRDTVEDFFYQRNSGFVGINTFTLSGGLAGTPNILERLSAEFRVTVKSAMPLTENYSRKGVITDELIDRQYEYTTAMGLALGTGAVHE